MSNETIATEYNTFFLCVTPLLCVTFTHLSKWFWVKYKQNKNLYEPIILKLSSSTHFLYNFLLKNLENGVALWCFSLAYLAGLHQYSYNQQLR